MGGYAPKYIAKIYFPEAIIKVGWHCSEMEGVFLDGYAPNLPTALAVIYITALLVTVYSCRMLPHGHDSCSKMCG